MSQMETTCQFVNDFLYVISNVFNLQREFYYIPEWTQRLETGGIFLNMISIQLLIYFLYNEYLLRT